MFCLLSIATEPESEVTPEEEEEECQYDPRQQGKQTPIDQVYKNPFLSHSHLCMFRMLP